MSDGYWKGSLYGEDAAGRDAQASSAYGVVDGQATGMSPEAPLDGGVSSNPYWRGDYGQDDHPDEVVARPSAGGSVSARARQVYAAEALRQKDHVAAGLLAIFLGVFGVHKFYLGCNQAGFIMLAVSIIGGILTLGLAAAVIELIAIIEGIVYLTKSQTEFDRIYVLHQRDWF